MATFVGVSLSIFQQFCGINAFIFYSGEIFKKVGTPQAVGVFLVNLANFVFVLPAIPLLGIMGRRTMMIVFTTVMFVSLLVMVVFTEWVDLGNASNIIEVVCTMIFVGAFEMSFGPILWLYLAEICTDQAIALAVLANWTSSLIVGQITPYMLSDDWLGNYTFLVYGGLCACSTLFICAFMKETKGLTEQQCKVLYAPKDDTFEKEEEADDK